MESKYTTVKDKETKPVRRGRLSRLLNGENIKNEDKHVEDNLTICDKHIDGA